MSDAEDATSPARHLPLIAWEELRGVEPAAIGRLVASWQGPTIPVHHEWEGEFATEAMELEVGDFIGHVAILVISTAEQAPADSKIYIVRPPHAPLSVAVFRDNDYVAMFELASSPQEHRAVPTGQCTVVGRVTYLIAPL
jgi:hypothetical protein